MANKLTAYLKGAKEELGKVSWPSKKQTSHLTLLVLSVSLLVAAFIGVVDFLLNKILEITI